MNNNHTQITLEMVDCAIAKVETANHVSLDSLKALLGTQPEQTIEMFGAMNALESLDDKYKQLMTKYPQMLENAQHVLETSVLLS
ncbi:hypothetical protein JCM19239_7299 [Vibrio variabilis]|uniref:Uncharacterized protein n=1 Tax=Vibrio variabilis TaxID=990271 RepID=A0ABQ0J7E4_9VIBR|nr:hypothetical protein JCM19239_7299 [Vibrio variabilis]